MKGRKTIISLRATHPYTVVYSSIEPSRKVRIKHADAEETAWTYFEVFRREAIVDESLKDFSLNLYRHDHQAEEGFGIRNFSEDDDWVTVGVQYPEAALISQYTPMDREIDREHVHKKRSSVALELHFPEALHPVIERAVKTKALDLRHLVWREAYRLVNELPQPAQDRQDYLLKHLKAEVR